MDLGSRVKKQASAQVQLVITIIHKRASCNNLIFILYMLIINILTLCTCRGNQTEFILKIIFGIYTHCQTRVTERYVSLYNLYKFALSDVYSLMYCIPYWRGYTTPHLACGLAPKTWWGRGVVMIFKIWVTHLFLQWYTKNTFIDLHHIFWAITRTMYYRRLQSANHHFKYYYE